MSVSTTGKNLSRKALDPMFLCMVGAMVLAVGSSLMLRAVAGPRPASASEDTAIQTPAPSHVHPRANPGPEN